MTPLTHVQPARDVAWEVVDDGSLLVCHLPTGTMLELSPPAGVLWTRISPGATLHELAATLAVELGVPVDQAPIDAVAFCQALAERDLVVTRA
jgi:hypothetical protein